MTASEIDISSAFVIDEDNCVLNTYRTTLSWKATGRLHHMSAYQVKSAVRRAALAEWTQGNT